MNEHDLFLAALEKQYPAERSAWLENACGGNGELRERVEQLLLAHEQAGSFLEDPVLAGDSQSGAASGGDAETHAAQSPSGIEDLPAGFFEPPEDPAHLGRLNHYEVFELLGRGGMGMVFRAFDPTLNRFVAIKLLAPQLAASVAARKRFAREAKAAAAVSHEQVVSIFAVDEFKGFPYLVMEFVCGPSLQDRLRRSGPQEVKEILRIGIQAAEGLAAAHAQGLVHRDIKPANILLHNGVERVKITDFGLARAVNDASLTQTGAATGTPEYMSPEQAQGGPIDHRSDLFSLGSTLYALCAGRPPFRGETTMAVLRRVCDDTPQRLREINPELPESLVAAIEKLQSKNPADRFSTVRELADELRRQLVALQQGPAAPSRAEISREPKRHSKSVVAAAAAALLVAVLGAGELSGVTHFVPTLVRLTQRDGTLAIEVDDPDIKVAIEGDGQEVNLSGAGLQELRLRPGEYHVRSDRDGRRQNDFLVTVVRGDRQVVKISSSPNDATTVAKETALSSNAVQSGNPFVLTANGEHAERRFATLSDAAASAANGDVIEVADDGPFGVPHIDFGDRAITIRAREGFSPVFRPQLAAGKKDTTLFETHSALTFEGISITAVNENVAPWFSMVTAEHATVRMANCRIAGSQWVRGVISSAAPLCEFENCMFVGPNLHCAVDWNVEGGGRLIMDNCAVFARYHDLLLSQVRPFEKPVSVQLRHCTFIADMVFNYWCSAPVRELLAANNNGAAQPAKVEADECVFDPHWNVIEFREIDQKKPLDLEEAETSLPSLISWSGNRNLFPATSRFLFLHWEKNAALSPPTAPAPHIWRLSHWQDYWKGAERSALEGLASYSGGDLISKGRPDPRKIVPSDFQLTTECPGHRVGADGHDLGVDVSKLGPGEAYRQWRNSPAYMRWQHP